MYSYLLKWTDKVQGVEVITNMMILQHKENFSHDEFVEKVDPHRYKATWLMEQELEKEGFMIAPAMWL